MSRTPGAALETSSGSPAFVFNLPEGNNHSSLQISCGVSFTDPTDVLGQTCVERWV